ncbi:TPA: DNA (cytosine-5-)-methyltransferase [Legionella pneumophila]|nr:DNA (cytosine-5-)-methyltransferase [Legionella pneumophila]HAT8181543.1 DNA (cytosine-5-)-methyltransferase [Legionella pneumophila]
MVSNLSLRQIDELPDFDKEDWYFANAQKELNIWRPCEIISDDPSIQVIDMFSGCGGMSLGFAAIAKSLGCYQLIGAADINERSLETYHHNFKVPAINADIRELSKSNKKLTNFLASLNGYNPELKQVLIGCAPCQGFSAHRKKRWDEPDERNGLIEAFADIVEQLMPDCIIMENVPELLSQKYWHHFTYFSEKLKSKGYWVKQAIHNAASQGVAQERFRAIVVAMKHDFSLPKERFNHTQFKTVRDVIGNLRPLDPGEVDSLDFLHKSAKHKQSTIDVIKAVPKNGGSRPSGVGPKCLQNFKGFGDVYGRLHWDKPSITITHYARNPASGRFVHPEQDRGLSMREVARLQSFPDGFEFKGASDDIYRQIGEAVPPLLSAAIASSTLANIKNENSFYSEDLIFEPVNNSYAGVIAGIKGTRK